MHGRYTRDRRLKARGIAAIDARCTEGRVALGWPDAAIKAKGGTACSFAIQVEIRLACFDLWRLLCLQSFLIGEASGRGGIVNKRRRELSRIHEQYDAIDSRFMRRVEALQLGKQPVMDLARRLQALQQEGK